MAYLNGLPVAALVERSLAHAWYPCSQILRAATTPPLSPQFLVGKDRKSVV